MALMVPVFYWPDYCASLAPKDMPTRAVAVIVALAVVLIILSGK